MSEQLHANNSCGIILQAAAMDECTEFFSACQIEHGHDISCFFAQRRNVYHATNCVGRRPLPRREAKYGEVFISPAKRIDMNERSFVKVTLIPFSGVISILNIYTFRRSFSPSFSFVSSSSVIETFSIIFLIGDRFINLLLKN